MKASRFGLSLLAAMQLALLAGCPSPTGRRRGPLNPDAGCSVSSRPVSGEACGSSAAVCDFDAPCDIDPADRSLAQIERCACIEGTWRCSTIESCFRTDADGGSLCPIVDDGRPPSFVCSERQRDLRCALPLITCPDGSRPPLSCRCDGSFWQCEPSRCVGEEDAGSGTRAAGQPCEGDEECLSPLRCERNSVAGGVCTTSCLQNTSSAREAAQCGGGESTCLFEGTDGVGVCAATCRPGVAASGCRPGFACTGRWFLQATSAPDRAGCAPFCTIDAHCPAGIGCNPRTGRCGEGANPTGLPDGSPCRFDGPNPCRGACLPLRANAEVGLCGSLIDLEQGRECPDDRTMPPLTRTGDNLALCVLTPCDASRCCPSGLVCEAFSGQRACVPDEPSVPNVACAAPDAGARDASADGG